MDVGQTPKVTTFFSKGDPFLGLASVELACKPLFFPVMCSQRLWGVSRCVSQVNLGTDWF